jgi:N4-gp56 family major capsid protein
VADSDFNTTNLAAFVKTTYDRLAYFALRPEMYFVPIATVKPSVLAMPGSPVTFTFYPDMAAATTPLNELTDPDTTSVTPTTKTVTLNEYGNVARTTKKYRGLAFQMPGPDPDVANLIGFNAGISQDTLFRDQLVAGTNVVYGGAATSRTTVGAATNITAAKVRQIAAKLRGANSKGWNGSTYLGFVHPDTAVDLMAETGVQGWVTPAGYSAADRIWNGSIGRFAGVEFIETPRAPLFVDASNGSGSTGTVDVYASLFVGQEALAAAHSAAESAATPQFVQGPVVDRLMRHHTFGWYWLGGAGRFREESLYRLETASTIGNN